MTTGQELLKKALAPKKRFKKHKLEAYEKSAYDTKMDREGKHGAEGSAKDLRMDKKAMGYKKHKKLHKKADNEFMKNETEKLAYKKHAKHCKCKKCK